MSIAPSGRRVLCNFQNLGSFEVQDDIGTVTHRVCASVPYGVLVFFPSYSLLDRLVDRWRATGMWTAIATLKEIVLEPRGVNSKVCDEVV